MIQFFKETDERREAGPMELWCLHGAVGHVADWRGLSKYLAGVGIGSRAVDLWRFLDCCPLSLPDFGKALNAEVGGQVFRGSGRALLGYSMGGRMALHALLEKGHPWQAAVITSAHPGLESEAECATRRAADAEWASQALTGDWKNFLDTWNAQAVLGGSLTRDAPTASALMQRRREVARSFVDWSLGAQRALWPRLAEIDVPVLWIAGEKDQKFRALAERASTLIPKCSLAIAPGAGHRVPWEAEAWFSQTVSHFLKRGENSES